ncbi:MAG: riboflavin synthase subunit beta [Lutibacter sp.]|uniref:riboflavin synthase subunit beta n=1 Tax=Lutibacter sp. TaxID=1925666 RepID=UPI0017B41AF2|nr:riboflavin synthase subunit beta [Lutibacter sp.]MBT8316997.1 riboflavin synthase subunit beta [Lutibacter sp.]NNJ57857.1 riboflavin synthase subunit beta [Lutibacter sp.]
MGFLKKRTNKKFDYKPRYYKGEGNPYQIGHKFDEFRTTVGGSKGLKEKFQRAFEESENSENRGFNKTILIIIAILVFIFLYIIDFDLSIFKNPF